MHERYRQTTNRRNCDAKYLNVTWDKANVIDGESDKSGRHIREAIWIRKTDNMNRDEGSY